MTAEDKPAYLLPMVTNRGFLRMPPVQAINYGGQVQVYESSNAEVAALWLKAEESPNTRSRMDRPGDATVQLTLENAIKLADQIYAIRDQHHMAVQP